MKPVLLAVVSDTHCNSTLGLCPPIVRLDEGGKYEASKAQKWLWANWLDYHAQIGALRKALGAKLIYCVNGDSCDGIDNHGSAQCVSSNPESQSFILHETFQIAKNLKPDEAHVIRGTIAHVGEGGAADELLGRFLGANRNADTRTWSSWSCRILAYGVEIDLQHHTSVGGLPWTVPGGVARLAFRHWAERLENGFQPADLIIRSHKHKHSDSHDAHKTRAIVTPAWQLKTSFGFRIAPESLADVGGIAVIVQPDGTYEVKKYLYKPALPTARSTT